MGSEMCIRDRAEGDLRLLPRPRRVIWSSRARPPLSLRDISPAQRGRCWNRDSCKGLRRRGFARSGRCRVRQAPAYAGEPIPGPGNGDRRQAGPAYAGEPSWPVHMEFVVFAYGGPRQLSPRKAGGDAGGRGGLGRSALSSGFIRSGHRWDPCHFVTSLPAERRESKSRLWQRSLRTRTSGIRIHSA